MPPWLNNLIPEWMKKSVCSCLIKRYLSQFIENEITRDQLNLDLYNGRATAERISLAVEALNELSESLNWPIEFVDGYIDKIHISVPWTNIFNDSTLVEICGLKITVQPKQRKEDATSMFESMWNSMTSSMHLAEEFVKEETKDTSSQAFEGIERFAQTIESIVRRIKVTFEDTVIQVEHLPKESEKGVGLLINIDLMKYYDEYSTEDPSNQDTLDPSKEDSKKAYLIDLFTTKDVFLEGVKVSTIEFPSIERTFSRSLIRDDSRDSSKEEETMLEVVENNETPPEEQTENIQINDNDNLSPDRHVIAFGQFYSKQEIRIRLKQAENLHGPKVAIEINLGSLILFLSPRQFHIIMELIDGFSSPDMEDNSNVPHKNHSQPRPMTERDYERVEEQLGNLLNPMMNYHGLNLQQTQGWSAGPLDESTDSQYLPMREAASGMFDSTMSGISSSMESSMNSSMISSVTDNTSHTRRRVCNVDADPTAEISRFQVRLATLAVILLHEDLLTQSTDNEKVLVKQMQNMAEGFFGSLDYSMFAVFGNNGFEHIHKAFERTCSLNHLRLLASPFQLEADEKTTSSVFSITGYLTAAKLELSEFLNTGGKLKHIPLINFNSSSANVPSFAKPNVKLKFKHVQKTQRSNNSNRHGPKTDLSISLDKCSVQFDLSIMDRITSLLNHPPICTAVKKEPNVWTTNLSNQAKFVSTPANESIVDLKVACSSLNFKVRFPIPDYRPPTDMSKVPWWERNVRPDYISLILQEAAFRTVFETNHSFSEYSIETKLLDIYYYESENTPGIHIGRSGKDEKNFSSLRDIPPTKLSIKIFPHKLQTDDDIEPDPMTHSFYGAFENQGNPQPGPFGSKKVVHESDTPHNKQRKDDSEELVIPGNKSEIKNFIESTGSNAQIVVELTLPMVSVQLQSKHIYELIYNRINNDLLLWKSGAPKPNTNNIYKTGYGQFNDLEFEDAFIMARSGVQYESESDASEEEEAVGGSVFYSTYDSKMKQSSKIIHGARRKSCQSGFVMSLQIGEGTLVLKPPVRDAGSNVIPGQQGEFMLNLNNADIFIVSGYKGDQDLGYVCVQLNNAQLYHCDIQPVYSTSSALREVGAIPGKYLFQTIYQSDEKTLPSSSIRGGDREMFSVAVKIQANHETHHVKVITVSLGLNKATLRHNMGREPNSWISHLIDFFNVQDYPIPGYVAKDVLTELHLHLWDCAIDYRPLHIPIRSVITIGNFSLSSHLTAVSNTSTLRLIFEECGLFLSEKAPPRNGVASNVKVDLCKDYVNVMELGLFEISIKTTDKKSGINPHIDLRASNNMLHIRTCSDSGRALFQLLTYYINDGDLNPEPQTSESTNASPKHQVEEELVSVEVQEHSLSKSQQDQVSELLEEAMEESPTSSQTGAYYGQAGAKLFYFPDEKEVLDQLPTHNLPQVAADLGDINAYHFGRNSDTDDEFCIVGNDTCSGLFPKDGVPEITWLAEEPLRVIENHMAVPVGKKDILEPPKDFPTPVMRYTLCEMTIVWQMYGGNDFKVQEPDAKKQVRFSEKQLSDRVSFSNAKSRVTINKTDDGRSGLSWVRKGGVDRDHSVLMELQLNKVRFRHDVYPETTRQASRQVLSISDVEIRDRLSSSQINKFLYQYSSQSRPKKSHSNMVLIKALHIRPDPKLKTQECMLKISLLPIRLNIDQDSLLFMINFFKELGGETEEKTPEAEKDSSLQNTPTHQPPIMTVSLDSDEGLKQQAKQVVNENLILLESRYHAEPEESIDSTSSNVADDSPIYFRYVEFSRDVLIRLDYQGKRVDMSHGPIPGLLMGLGQLNCSEIRLKRIVHRHGLLGFTKLFSYLLQEWLGDIKKNQLSNILGGVGPMHAVLQLFQGVKDLFWLPIEQYQKDGRIVRGLQRGANSFTTSTAMAALELTTRIIYFIQITAETAYDMLSPGPSIRMKKLAKHRGRKKRYHQPQDIREGLTNACMVVKEGIGETADNILQVAAMEKEQKGISGAVGAVIRQIPPTILKPILIASEATTNVLGGMQSQLVPDARKEANQKWRSDS